MARLIIAIAIGAVIAVGGVFGLKAALSNTANGNPQPHASLSIYGNR